MNEVWPSLSCWVCQKDMGNQPSIHALVANPKPGQAYTQAIYTGMSLHLACVGKPMPVNPVGEQMYQAVQIFNQLIAVGDKRT